ncbi:DHH family phosphoesterase [Microbacterium oryzae]|uniref:DHH family phosphoesterase n=1 Tax=Microbacterium oryzae TaxID=743009 RepID=UPI0031DA06F4
MPVDSSFQSPACAPAEAAGRTRETPFPLSLLETYMSIPAFPDNSVDADFGGDILTLDEFFDDSLFRLLKDNRGWTEEYLDEINDATHEELQNVGLMVEELRRMQKAGEQIVVVPDFDMDGVTSGVIAWAGLSELGFDVQLHVPDYRRGHDITPETIQDVRIQFPHAAAIITTDAGINSHAGLAEARKLGLHTLVTDHHVELAPGCNADIAVNPARIGETYAHPGICGAHVIHQVLTAYAGRYAQHKVTAIGLLRLFAGIGTVSDVMPLLYENRRMVRDAISIARLLYVPIPPDDVREYNVEDSILMILLRNHDHSPEFVGAFEGFALLMQAFREHRRPMLDANGDPILDWRGQPRLTPGKLLTSAELTEDFFGFQLAPAFNAVRRIEGDMADAFGVFTAATAEEKYAHATALLDGNEQRKELSAQYLRRLWAEVDGNDHVAQPLQAYGVYFTDAPVGMLGLLAASVTSSTGRPTVVARRPADPSGPVSGSARSPQWFPVISTLTPLGYTAIGHEHACGVHAADRNELLRLAVDMRDAAEALNRRAVASGELEHANQADLILGPTPDAHAGLVSVDALKDLADDIRALAPFGHGFERPVIELIVDLTKCGISTLGASDQHLRLVLPIGLKVLWWNAAHHLLVLRSLAKSNIPGGSLLRLRVTLGTSKFRGEESVQAVVDRAVGNGIE